MTVSQQLDLKPLPQATFLTLLHQQPQPVARHLHRQAPARHALFHQQLQRINVVDIQRRSGNKRQPALSGHVNGAEIIGLNQKLAVLDVTL